MLLIHLHISGVTARVQFDASVGGDVFSTTSSTLLGRGILEETGFDRFIPVVTKGLSNDDTPNTTQTTANNHYWTNTGVYYDENSTYDASVMRLREFLFHLLLQKHF